MIGLVDGDIVVFRCGFAAERTAWNLHIPAQDYTGIFEYKREAMDELDKRLPGKFSRVEYEDYQLFPEKQLEPLSHALQNVRTLMNRIAESCQLNEFDMQVCLSSSKNFRHEIAKTRPYKGNRKKEHRPTYETKIRDYLKENYDCYTGENEEADDLMGIKATAAGPEDSIIITLDKDLDQVPGLKYNWVHDVGYNVTPEQACYNFHLQLLMGDTTDNIPGLPGIGAGKAAKALHGLETEQEQMEEVCRMYQIHSGKKDWKEYLTEQGRLLWIRREPDQLWTPDIEEVADEWDGVELTLELS